jgi:tetratricopeptide (TPR) repeat protein
MEMVIRSEVAMYFDRLEDAAALLEEVAPRIADIGVAARFSLTRGRLALWHGDAQQAETQLQSAYHFYLFLNDSFGISRALLNLARFARTRGKIEEAAANLEAARTGIKGRTSKRTEYLRGVISTEQAAAASDRGEIEEAARCTRSDALLKNHEKGATMRARWSAWQISNAPWVIFRIHWKSTKRLSPYSSGMT